MRTILKVKMTDVEVANNAFREGNMERAFQNFTTTYNPEASYFFSEDGFRTGLFVFDLNDVSAIPEIAEPFFLELNAEVLFYPAMNFEELKTGLNRFSNKTPEESSHGFAL